MTPETPLDGHADRMLDYLDHASRVAVAEQPGEQTVFQREIVTALKTLWRRYRGDRHERQGVAENVAVMADRLGLDSRELWLAIEAEFPRPEKVRS